MSELLLLLVQTRVVDRERRLAGDRERRVHRLVRDRIAGPEGEDLEHSDRLGGGRDGDDGAGPSPREKRLEQLVAALDANRQAVPEQLLHGGASEGLGTRRGSRAPRHGAARP